MLWLCLHLPDLALEVFARGAPATDPLVVVYGNGRKRRVVLCNAAAHCHGIRPDMGLNAAHALAGSLRVCERDGEAEHATLDRLAAWSGQFTSTVSRMSPQALLLEVAGSCRLFGGLDRLRETVSRGVTELGYRASLAIAPTPLAASWLAQAGREACITRQDALAEMLAPLPTACLGLTAGQGETLYGMGVRTIGDCLRLPRDGFARRMGPELARAIDRALGRIPDPRPAFVAPSVFASSMPLVGATDTEGLLFPLRRLLLELQGFLCARDAGTRSLTLSLHHAAAGMTRVGLELVTPSRDATHLTLLLRERLEHTALPAPVEEISLRVSDIFPLSPRNIDFFAPVHAAEGALIERLRARMGRDAVRGLDQVAEHRPERAWTYAEPGNDADVRSRSSRRPQGSTHRSRGTGGRIRPLWLLREPMPLEVRDELPYLDGALVLERERERIESGWWDGQDVARDYFIARSGHGVRLWVYREIAGEHRWFVHGVFG
ncbi:MAG: Y-family DNA polymerase [Acidiferrobacterales bacterium]